MKIFFGKVKTWFVKHGEEIRDILTGMGIGFLMGWPFMIIAALKGNTKKEKNQMAQSKEGSAQ